MILAKETTQWDVDHTQPNHTYLLSDNMENMFGYFKCNNPKDFMMFKKPIRFDKRYRKFKVIQKGIVNI